MKKKMKEKHISQEHVDLKSMRRNIQSQREKEKEKWRDIRGEKQ